MKIEASGLIKAGPPLTTILYRFKSGRRSSAQYWRIYTVVGNDIFTMVVYREVEDMRGSILLQSADCARVDNSHSPLLP